MRTRTTLTTFTYLVAAATLTAALAPSAMNKQLHEERIFDRYDERSLRVGKGSP